MILIDVAFSFQQHPSSVKHVIDRDEKDRTGLAGKEISALREAQSKEGNEVGDAQRLLWGLGRKHLGPGIRAGVGWAKQRELGQGNVDDRVVKTGSQFGQ